MVFGLIDFHFSSFKIFMNMTGDICWNIVLCSYFLFFENEIFFFLWRSLCLVFKVVNSGDLGTISGHKLLCCPIMASTTGSMI